MSLVDKLKRILGSAYDLYPDEKKIYFAAFTLREGPPSEIRKVLKEGTTVSADKMLEFFIKNDGKNMVELAKKLSTPKFRKMGRSIVADGGNWKVGIRFFKLGSTEKVSIYHECEEWERRKKYGLHCRHVIRTLLDLPYNDIKEKIYRMMLEALR